MFKRLLVLAVFVALFVTGFFLYFYLSDAQIEGGFRRERQKFQVDGMVLTTANPPSLQTGTTPSAAPAAPSAPTPVAPDATSPPAADPNASSTNAPAGPSSTFVLPGLSHLPLLTVAALNGLRVQTNPVAIPAEPATPAAVTPTPRAETTPATTNPALAAPASTAAAAHAPLPVASSVIVLGYHQFTGPGVPSKNIYSMRQDVFEEEMKYLKDNNYHVVPLSDVVRFVKHEIGLPPNAVAITIDDGYKSSIVWAAPVLKKYGYPWTFFVYPDFITVAEGKGAASWNDLLQLQADGVDVECHSKSHPILPSKRQKFHGPLHVLTPPEYDQFLTDETAGAKETLEKHLNKPIKYFAYPYGEYNKEVEAKAIAAGFEAIFTVANNPVHPSTDIHSIGRYIITEPVEKLFAAYLRQGALGVAEASPAPGATISDPRPIITAVLGYAGNLDPASISADVRDFGEVRHDFDPKTLTVRLYLPRDLIQPVVVVNIRAKDAATEQKMVASWRFNYVPAAPAAAHAPMASGVSTNAPAAPAAGVAPGTVRKEEVNEGEHEEARPATNATPAPSVAPAAPATTSPAPATNQPAATK